MISRLAIVTAMAWSMSGAAFAQDVPGQQTPPPPTASTATPPPGTQTPTSTQDGAAPPAAAVTDTGNAASDGTATGKDIVVTGRFVETGARSAMKMDVRVLDTPYSVQSYSNSFVKSLEVQNLSDLYNYMTGLKKSGVTAYDITIRGFKSSGTDRNALLVDGLPGLTGRYTSPPTIGIDHVELVKGPMSVLYGQIQPGGFVNMITKKPSDKAVTTIELRGNSYAVPGLPLFNRNGYAGAIDSTGPLIGDALQYRVVGQITRNDTFRNYNYTRQEFVQPSLRVKLGENTTVTGQFEYRHTREHFDVGLAAPFNGATNATSTVYDINAVADRRVNYTQPDNYRDETGKAYDVFAVHHFSDKWKVAVSFRHVDYFSDQQDISSNDVARYGGILGGAIRVQRRARQLQTTRTYDYGDGNVTGTFDIFGAENKFILGINGGVDKVRNNRLKFYAGATRSTTTGVCPAGQICLDVDLYNPDLSPIDFNALPTGPASGLTDQNTLARSYGIYVSDLISLTDWLKVTVALRKFSEYTQSRPDVRNQPTNVSEKTNSKDALPSAGILIEPTHNLTFYGSYAESFVPPDPGLTDVNGNNAGFQPITAKQYELGLKTQNLFDQRLGFTAAVYRIDQNGQISQFICPPGAIANVCSVQVGTTRSQGFEFEGNASPMRNWQVLFGYSHIDATVIKSIDALAFQTGRRLPNVAKDAANIWTRYDFGSGFGIGLGVTYTGQREGILPTTATDLKPLNLPAYTLVDAGLYYTHAKFTLDLKLTNIFDKLYYESSGGGSQGRVQIQPGAPRYLTLTGRISF